MAISEQRIKEIILEELLLEQQLLHEKKITDYINQFKNSVTQFFKKNKKNTQDPNSPYNIALRNWINDYQKFLINNPNTSKEEAMQFSIQQARQVGMPEEDIRAMLSQNPPPLPKDEEEPESISTEDFITSPSLSDEQKRKQWRKEREEDTRNTWGARPQGFYDDEPLVPKGRIATYKENKNMKLTETLVKQLIKEEINKNKQKKKYSQQELNELFGIGQKIGQKIDYAKGYLKGTTDAPEPKQLSTRQMAGEVSKLRGEIKNRFSKYQKSLEDIKATINGFDKRIENLPGMKASQGFSALADDINGAENKIKAIIEKDPSLGVAKAGASGAAGAADAGGAGGAGDTKAGEEKPGMATRAAQAVGGVIGAGVGAFKQAAGGGGSQTPAPAAGAAPVPAPATGAAGAAGATGTPQPAQAMKFSDAKKANANINILTYANSVLGKDPEFAKMFPFPSRAKVQSTILDIAKQLNVKPEELLAENIKNTFFSKNYNYNKIIKEQQNSNLLSPDERKKLFDYLLSKNYIKSDLIDKVKQAITAPAAGAAPVPAPAAAGAAPVPAPATGAAGAGAGAGTGAPVPAPAAAKEPPKEFKERTAEEQKDAIETYAKKINKKHDATEVKKVIKYLFDNNIFNLNESKSFEFMLLQENRRKKKKAEKKANSDQTVATPSTTGNTSTTTLPVGSNGMTTTNTNVTAVGVSPDNDTGSSTGQVVQQPNGPETTQTAEPSDASQQSEDKLKKYAKKLANDIGVDSEIVEDIIRTLKDKMKDASLISEQLISRKNINNSLTNEQIKRMKLLAGIIK